MHTMHTMQKARKAAEKNHFSVANQMTKKVARKDHLSVANLRMTGIGRLALTVLDIIRPSHNHDLNIQLSKDVYKNQPVITQPVSQISPPRWSEDPAWICRFILKTRDP